MPRMAFYEKHLGFRLSDWLSDRMAFLRCSTEHHSLAIAKRTKVSLNHVSFEMRGIDEYLRGTGRLLRHGHKPLWGPGRHSAGDNTFSYFSDPHGNVVEYTTELHSDHRRGRLDAVHLADLTGVLRPVGNGRRPGGPVRAGLGHRHRLRSLDTGPGMTSDLSTLR